MAERKTGSADIDKMTASLDSKRGIELGELSVSTLDGVVYNMKQQLSEGGANAPFLEAMISAVQGGELRFPVIPRTVMRVQELMRDREVSVEDLSFIVSLDPALATKVVGVANSAFYSGADSIRSVGNAIMRLGTREATNVAIAVAMRSSLFKVPGFESDARSIWHHSLLVARINEAILTDRPRFQDMAFLMGLVLEVGRIVVLAFGAQLANRGKGSKVFPTRGIKAAADSLHPILGALILQSWSFDDHFVHTIRHHHDAELDEKGDERAELIQACQLSDAIALRIAEGWASGAIVLDPPIAQALEDFGIPELIAPAIVTTAQEDFGGLTSLV